MTPADLLRLGRERLVVVGIEDALADARALLQHAQTAWPPDALSADGTALQDAFFGLIERRIAGEPVDRIIGRRGFWTLDLALSPGTLSPRPDSETVVAAALSMRGDSGAEASDALRVLDLGCGTGALLLAVLSERPGACGVGVDLSLDALRTARRNAAAHGLAERCAFVCADWHSALAGRFDLILCNPPYIPSGDIPALDREVREHDPALALDGGADGLAAYRAILAGLATVMGQGAAAVFEIGIGQHGSVPALARDAGFTVAAVVPDLGGIPRAVVLRRA